MIKIVKGVCIALAVCVLAATAPVAAKGEAVPAYGYYK